MRLILILSNHQFIQQTHISNNNWTKQDRRRTSTGTIHFSEQVDSALKLIQKGTNSKVDRSPIQQLIYKEDGGGGGKESGGGGGGKVRIVCCVLVHYYYICQLMNILLLYVTHCFLYVTFLVIVPKSLSYFNPNYQRMTTIIMIVRAAETRMTTTIMIVRAAETRTHRHRMIARAAVPPPPRTTTARAAPRLHPHHPVIHAPPMTFVIWAIMRVITVTKIRVRRVAMS